MKDKGMSQEPTFFPASADEITGPDQKNFQIGNVWRLQDPTARSVGNPEQREEMGKASLWKISSVLKGSDGQLHVGLQNIDDSYKGPQKIVRSVEELRTKVAGKTTVYYRHDDRYWTHFRER